METTKILSCAVPEYTANKLRLEAHKRGISVSELLRGILMREVDPQPVAVLEVGDVKIPLGELAKAKVTFTGKEE